MGRFFVATRKGLFAARRGAAGFEIVGPWHSATPVTAVLVDAADGDRVYAALEHGHYGPKLHRSDDGGETWSEVGTPAFGADDGATVKSIFCLAAGSAPGHIWAGTIGGGLFHSTDRGATWALCRALWDDPQRKEWFGGGTIEPGVHSVEVDPRDRHRLLVAISCGGVWASDDDGQTFELRGRGLRADFMPPERRDDPAIQDPHRIVRCAADPDVVWCQHHCGIFRSTDAGRTFTAIEGAPSSFGFAVAAHPRDPRTAWFVPAVRDDERVPVDGALVVSRTTDGGASFDVLRDGLPQRHAYDLVYRHALDVLADGRTLAFGSTTGNLWVSEDGGGSFQAVASHLPPIAAVVAG